MNNENAALRAEVARRMAENNRMQRLTIGPLSHLAEACHPETSNHILRTQGNVQPMAIGLQNHRQFTAILIDSYIELLTRSAPLHDVGKVGSRDAIERAEGDTIESAPQRHSITPTGRNSDALFAVRPYDIGGATTPELVTEYFAQYLARAKAGTGFSYTSATFMRRIAVFQRLMMRKAPSLVALWVGCCGALAWAGTVAVTNENSASVSFVDTDSNAVIGELKLAGKPRGIAVSADGKTLYVSEQSKGELLFIDTATRTISHRLPLGESPEAIYLSPDGQWITAAMELTNSVVFVSVPDRAVAFSVKVKGDNPEHAVWHPSGKFVYSSAEEDDKVDVIDVEKRTQIAQIKVGARPRGIAFTPDGKKAYVACERSNEIVVLDALKLTVVKRVPAGVRSNGTLMSADGKTLYVSNGGAKAVQVLDTATDTFVASIPVGERPWNMSLSKSGDRLYVANGRSHSVTVIDTAARKALKDVSVGQAPWGTAAW